MFMLGGPSQIDLFDPKPALYKWHGKSFEGDIKFDNAAQASREIMAPLWKYRNHGQCGMELSELLPHLGGIADDITLIRSHAYRCEQPSAFQLCHDNRTAPWWSCRSWQLVAARSWE